jgi:hypothetical protein
MIDTAEKRLAERIEYLRSVDSKPISKQGKQWIKQSIRKEISNLKKQITRKRILG